MSKLSPIVYSDILQLIISHSITSLVFKILLKVDELKIFYKHLNIWKMLGKVIFENVGWIQSVKNREIIKNINILLYQSIIYANFCTTHFLAYEIKKDKYQGKGYNRFQNGL